jgi:Tat protein translocase TatB subunit
MDIFGIGAPELVVILIIALIVLGPQRLPEMARTVGKTVGEFRKIRDEATAVFREVVETAQQETITPFRDAVNAAGEPVQPNGLPYPVDTTGIHPMFRRDSTARIPAELLPVAAATPEPPGYTPPAATAPPATLWYPAPGDPNAPPVKKQTRRDNTLDYPPPFGES